jgi:hypothetical protein
MREVADSMELRRFSDEDGVELLDVSDGPLPDPETPAPVRFLPQYDNVLLGHQDRSRMFHPEQGEAPLFPRIKGFFGTVLIGGYVSAAWKLVREREHATLELHPAAFVAAGELDDLQEEGLRLLAFLAPDADSRELSLVRP